MKKKHLFSGNICTSFPDRPAVVGDGFSVSYAELNHSIAAFSKVLSDKGVKKGTRVALWGYNSANWLISFFAIVRAGGTAVLLNYSAETEDAADLLCMSATSHIICGDNAQTRGGADVMGKLAKLSGIDEACCIDIRGGSVDLCASLKDAPEGPEVLGEDETGMTSVIIFTSGTTSKPKAVQNSQFAISTNSDAFLAGIGEAAGSGICIAVPLFHILGLLMSYSYLRIGATICLPANYKPQTLAEAIGTYGISDMAAVGAIYLSLVDYKDFAETVVPHIHLCMIAGGMSTPVQMMRLELDFANAIFINMYGQSEVAPISMVRPSDLVEKRAQTVGCPVDGLEVRIHDEKRGFLPQGDVGEVVARGAGLMNGYYGLPRDKQPVDDDGWIHTGDLGYFDLDGFLHLAGRIKDIIIRGGENISPSEIEQALVQLPYIKDAKVMGAPHPIFGESVEACVTTTGKDSSVTEETVKTELKDKLARFKIPSHVFFYDSFPLNVNGKIDQRTLHADMLTKVRAIYIDEELAGGVKVFDLIVKNSRYAIVPVTRMVSGLADHIGFSRKKVQEICLAVEEMLTERIEDAYSAVGDINVRVTLLPEWLRVSFSDTGAEYVIDKRLDTSMSAKIILATVDNFHTDRMKEKPVYCMDFLYKSDLNIREFLMKEEQQE